MKKITLVFIIIASLMLGSCNQEETKNNAVTGADSQAIKLDSALFNSTLEPGISISEAKKLKVGDEVVTSGKILGANSFVEGRAIFVMGDPEVLISCDLKENDNCKTPWDVSVKRKKSSMPMCLVSKLLTKKAKY